MVSVNKSIHEGGDVNMSISIFGLDKNYADCAREMGAKIDHHDDVIDVKFPCNVIMSTDDGGVVYLAEREHGVGMVLTDSEFFVLELL